MKVACPNCHKPLRVPDEWSGRTAKCQHCAHPFVVPGEPAAGRPVKPAAPASRPATGPVASEPGDPDALDLQALAGMVPDDTQSVQAPMDSAPRRKKTWFKAKAPAAAPVKQQVVKGPDGKMYRICPHCGRQTHSDDLYMDVFCSQCGKTIPAGTQAEDVDFDNVAMIGGKGKDKNLTVGFYDGLVGAFGYPIGAIESVLLGSLVAIGVIVLPTALMMGLIYVMKQEPVSGDKFDVGSWPGMALFSVLMVQLIYCAGVGFYAVIDSIRSTIGGAERPPDLVWNLTTVMGSLIGYIGFVIFYALLLLLGVWVSGGLSKTPTTLDEVRGLVESRGMYAYMAILTFFIPMTIIGLAAGNGLQGLNPLRIVRSIASTGLHYGFLYAIMLIYVGLMSIAVLTMIGYTGETIVKVYKLGMDQGAGPMAMGVVFWGLLLAGGFFGQYVLGRILGLFAREFQMRLSFRS